MNYYGYVTSREFGSMSMPVPAQNSCLREYVARQKGVYVLPYLESNFPNCFHQLFGLLHKMEPSSFLIMYSLTMLPSETQKRNELFDLVIQKNIQLCFVLENLSTSDQTIIESEIAIYDLKSLCISKEKLMKTIETAQSGE